MVEMYEPSAAECKNIKQWQLLFADNTDLDNPDKGIRGYATKLFPETIKERFGFPPIHKEMYEEFLLLYDPSKTLMQERQLQEILFRGASKSTLALLVCSSYIGCYNGKEILLPNGEKALVEEDVAVLASETNSFATNWSMRIRSEFGTNRTLTQIFGRMRSRGITDEEGNWTKGCFTILRSRLPEIYRGKDMTFISRGVGQQIRGLNIHGRPTIVFADDLYSLKGTLTPETRAKTRYWFNSECKNTLDNVEGKIMSIGTVVHEDTVVVDHKKNTEDWKTVEHAVMPLENFQKVISEHCKVDRDIAECSIPDATQCMQLEQHGYITLWPQKFPLRSVLLKFRESIVQRTEAGFWQEMFHQVITEKEKTIKQSMMRVKDFDIVIREGDKVPFVRIVEGGEVEYRNVNLGIGMDCATSFKPDAANSAIVYFAIDYRSRVYVITAAQGKWGTRDEMKDGVIETKGTVDEVFRILGKDERPRVVIEVNHVGAEVSRSFKRQARRRGVIINPIEVTQTTNKIERIRDALSPYYQTMSVIHRPGQEMLMHQLQYLGKTGLNDLADAFSTGMAYVKAPPKSIPFKQGDKEEHYRTPDFLKGFIPPSHTAREKWRMV